MTLTQYPKPTIVCLVGSTRFYDEFTRANFDETMAGRIVLTVGFFHHTAVLPITPAKKLILDELHLRKIDLADEVLVINPGSYIGNSTRREIWYAARRDKCLRWLDAVRSEPDGFDLRDSYLELRKFINSWFTDWDAWRAAVISAANPSLSN